MEYTYKVNAAKNPVTVILGEYSLTLHTEGRETLIPYANILSIQLKKSGKKFLTIIKPADLPEVQISNQYISSSNRHESGCAQYVLFVRVLHIHLKKKSMAYYVCGNSLQNILLISCLSVVIAFGLSYMADLVWLNPFNNNITALILSIINIGVIIVINWGHFPNVYKPENIPLQFLPTSDA